MSVSKQIADVQRLMKCSGLNYTMHSAGTTVGNLPSDFMNDTIPVLLSEDPQYSPPSELFDGRKSQRLTSSHWLAPDHSPNYTSLGRGGCIMVPII